MVFTTVPLAAFLITSGSDRLTTFRSSPFGERTYCRNCGAPLTIHVTHQSDEIDIAAGALDNPNAVTPTFHIFADAAPQWVTFEDDLPRFPELRPDTRGLAKGQTNPDVSPTSAAAGSS